MDGAGDQVFTDAAFARQQNGGSRGRHAHDGGEKFLHHGAAADDVVEFVAVAQFFAQLPILITQRAYFQRLLHNSHQVVERERF